MKKKAANVLLFSVYHVQSFVLELKKNLKMIIGYCQIHVGKFELTGTQTSFVSFVRGQYFDGSHIMNDKKPKCSYVIFYRKYVIINNNETETKRNSVLSRATSSCGSLDLTNSLSTSGYWVSMKISSTIPRPTNCRYVYSTEKRIVKLSSIASTRICASVLRNRRSSMYVHINVVDKRLAITVFFLFLFSPRM